MIYYPFLQTLGDSSPFFTHIVLINGIFMEPISHFQMQNKIKERRLLLNKMFSFLSSHSKFWNILAKHLAGFLTFCIEGALGPVCEVNGTTQAHTCITVTLVWPYRSLCHQGLRDWICLHHLTRVHFQQGLSPAHKLSEK